MRKILLGVQTKDRETQTSNERTNCQSKKKMSLQKLSPPTTRPTSSRLGILFRWRKTAKHQHNIDRHLFGFSSSCQFFLSPIVTFHVIATQSRWYPAYRNEHWLGWCGNPVQWQRHVLIGLLRTSNMVFSTEFRIQTYSDWLSLAFLVFTVHDSRFEIHFWNEWQTKEGIFLDFGSIAMPCLQWQLLDKSMCW